MTTSTWVLLSGFVITGLVSLGAAIWVWRNPDSGPGPAGVAILSGGFSVALGMMFVINFWTVNNFKGKAVVAASEIVKLQESSWDADGEYTALPEKLHTADSSTFDMKRVNLSEYGRFAVIEVDALYNSIKIVMENGKVASVECAEDLEIPCPTVEDLTVKASSKR